MELVEFVQGVHVIALGAERLDMYAVFVARKLRAAKCIGQGN